MPVIRSALSLELSRRNSERRRSVGRQPPKSAAARRGREGSGRQRRWRRERPESEARPAVSGVASDLVGSAPVAAQGHFW